ncbi:hypothetical protein M426DRAFT_319828 [Hypoxylon sp. CI-4A]|nr:hypothetical protein M426DRAFT_319828 [Hypoxylon sp. CI-4A]
MLQTSCRKGIPPQEFHRRKGHEDSVATVEYLWHEICKNSHFDLGEPYINGDEAVFAFMQTLSNGSVQGASREGKRYADIPKSHWLEQAALYLTKTLGETDVIAPKLRSLAEMAKRNGVREGWSRLANGASKNRRFARTRKGYYVLGPAVMEEGDIVCVLFGGKMPFCLRPVGEQRYLLVGECYVHGLMEGEAMDMMTREQLSASCFELL